MFCLVKKDVSGYRLVPYQNIFPRPTPWLVAWKAFFGYLGRRQTYHFVYFSPQFNDLSQYAIDAEEGTIVLRDRDGEEVFHASSFPMTWQLWALYVVESWLCGPLLKFWHWRWAEEKIDRLARKKTERIEPEDED